jgi:DNA-binding response OmpR family regulator
MPTPSHTPSESQQRPRRLAPTVLVIEDETTLAEALQFNLERQGYRVLLEHDGLAGLARFEREAPDLVLLDVMLPGLDGFEVCRRMRARSNAPVLMLTARGEEIDRVLGLEIGADDYLVKPFSLRELQARVRALLRRAGAASAAPLGQATALTAGDLRVSAAERRVWRGERELRLRPREFELLLFLMRNRGIALSRRQILDGAWGSDYFGEERTVDVHVRALREALEEDAAQPTHIVTVRGVGYRFAE